MLCRQDGGVDRAESCIRDDERGESEAQDEIVQDNMLHVIPTQGTDNAAAPLHRQIIRPLLCLFEVLLDFVEIHGTVFNLRGKMRRYGVTIDVGDACILCRESRNLRHMERIARQERAVREGLRPRERRLVVTCTQPRIVQLLYNQPRDIGLADVRTRPRDK